MMRRLRILTIRRLRSSWAALSITRCPPRLWRGRPFLITRLNTSQSSTRS
uniref:Uncharacterized protein n=1 Tax=uncultured marine virus TaxID=186617 RepID=A0A0F7L7E0_9VIRU|nr:hypothetical protein [uncultured marine virus]